MGVELAAANALGGAGSSLTGLVFFAVDGVVLRRWLAVTNDKFKMSHRLAI